MKELGITKGEVKPEFTTEQIRAFVAKNYNSVSARYVKSAIQHYDELLQQRDELREALKNLMDGVKGLPPLTAIVGVLEKQYKQAEAVIKNTDG